MKRAYDEIMDRVQVTAEIRGRILETLQETNLTPERKIPRLPSAKRALSLAACFVLLLVGATLLPRLRAADEPDPPVLTVPDIVEAASLRELCGLVGFAVEEIPHVPFTVEEATYTAYWRELAQVTYTGEGQSLTFRKSVGDGDNSGDYTAYEEILERVEDGETITLKGIGGAFYLVLWQSGEYVYSLRFDPGVSEDVCMGVWGEITGVPGTQAHQGEGSGAT